MKISIETDEPIQELHIVFGPSGSQVVTKTINTDASNHVGISNGLPRFSNITKSEVVPLATDIPEVGEREVAVDPSMSEFQV